MFRSSSRRGISSSSTNVNPGKPNRRDDRQESSAVRRQIPASISRFAGQLLMVPRLESMFGIGKTPNGLHYKQLSVRVADLLDSESRVHGGPIVAAVICGGSYLHGG